MAMTIKISKPGYDVEKETDARYFIFDANFNHLKTVKSGSFEVTVGGGLSDTTAVSHGLDYSPAAIAYFRNTADDKWYIASTDPEFAEARVNVAGNVLLYVNDTFAYFKVQNHTGSSKTFEVKYEIFYEGEE